MKLKYRKGISTIVASFSLILGVFIYTFLRKPIALLFDFLEWTHLSEWVFSLRESFLLLNLPQWVLYGLPDFLWMFSLTLFVLTIWDFKLNPHSLLWISLVILIGLGFEISQSTGLLNGVFDFWDIGFILAGILLAFTFTIKTLEYANHN